MIRAFHLVLLFALAIVAQDIPDSIPVDSSSDSARLQLWLGEWWGTPQTAILGKSKWKTGEYDSTHLRFPLSASIKEGKFEFGITGYLPMDKELAIRYKKAKGAKLQVHYHDREFLLPGKKKESRFAVIDQVTLLWDTLTIPVLAEIWIPQKLTESDGYRQWRDTLMFQGVLSSTTRSWLELPPGEFPVPMLQWGGKEWMSRYSASRSSFSYPCAPAAEHILCRRFSRDDLSGACPQGTQIPDTADLRSLLNAWHGGADTVSSPLPFRFTFRAWEVREADSTSKNTGTLLLTPWTGGGQIEPHFWSYLETFAKDSAGQTGVFQMGWSETGWMSEFETDLHDQKMHPVRCVKIQEAVNPPPSPAPGPVDSIAPIRETAVSDAPVPQEPAESAPN